MRVLLIGAVLGALLGGCSFLMLGTIPWLQLPHQLLASVVLGLSFAGLVWTFGIVRFIVTRFDRRGKREAATAPVSGETTEPVEAWSSQPYDSMSSDGPVEMQADVHYDDDTGTIDTGFIEMVDEPSVPPSVREELGPRRDLSPPVSIAGEFEPFDEEDENTTQLISREELKALAQALLEGRESPEAVEPLGHHEIEQILSDAEYAVEQGRFDEALESFSQVVAGASDARAYLGRGRVYLDHSDFERAASDFAMAEELAPGAPEPLLAMGDLCFAAKDYLQSIDYFTLALGQQPDHAMALARRGISQFYRKEFALALADLQQAASLDPDIPLVASYLARAERRVRGIPTSVPHERRRR